MIEPLQGYRILDFTKLVPGPLATLWMAQRGAEVIKVESPSSPDPVRFYPPMKDGVSVFYSTLNAGKKSLSVDYRSEEGKEVILKLIETADVVVEQFRPGVMEAFGLDYESLKARNPKIILVSITGYGQTGAMASTPGHDINIVGIDPDYKVHIREDILEEVDGPMLQHGIKEMDMRSLWIPPAKSKQPDRERLAERFTVFQNQ